MSSNRLISAVKQMGDNYQPSTNNVVAIDTLNNRLGINTSSPQYSIEIGNSEGNNNKMKIVNLLIDGNTCDISSINNNYINIDKFQSRDISCTTINNTIIFSDSSLVINSDISVNGSLFIPNIESINTVNGNLSSQTITADSTTTNFIVVSSDDRLKHNEEPINNALDIIDKLEPKIYQKTKTFLPANFRGKLTQEYIIEAGLIAQQVEQIPELKYSVIEGNSIRPYSLNYNNIFVYSIAGIKQLNNKVDNNYNYLDVSINKINQQLIDNNQIVNSKIDNIENTLNSVEQELKNFTGLQERIDKIDNIDNINKYVELVSKQAQQIQRLTSQYDILSARIMTLEQRNK
tara:strand:- start:2243 stop:3283 length:1041 start_codon:yes stop_codon:yes gene_type:complete